jgi:RNA recognition motif-containing protein
MYIFIGKLGLQVTKYDLEKLFSEYGEIQLSIVMLNKTAKTSRGFGFVVMRNSKQADNAIKNLNNHILHDENIMVKKARPGETKYLDRCILRKKKKNKTRN